MTSACSANGSVRLTVVGVLAVVSLILSAFTYKMTQPRILNQYELREYGVYLNENPRRFSDFQLVDHSGSTVTKEMFLGKWSLIFFGFTHCPDVCPTTLATVAKMYKELSPSEQQDLQIILLTVDPERDTVAKLAEYVPYFHSDFKGLTGAPAAILKLATEVSIAFVKTPLANGEYSVDHSGSLVLINPRGDFHGIFRQPVEHGSLRVAWRSIRKTFKG